MFLPLKWILIIPGTTSPTVHLVLIIPIVTAGIHFNGVRALGGGESEDRAWSGDAVAWGGSGKWPVSLGEWEIWRSPLWLVQWIIFKTSGLWI